MGEATEMTLVPRPESVLALIELVVTSGWPDRDADQAAYLRHLGFHQGEGQTGFQKGYGYVAGPDSSEVLGGELLSVDLAVSHASWASHKGELYFLNFFLYDGQDNAAVLGYRFVYSQLVSMYGQPKDATVRPLDEATSFWEVNGTSIEMYCFTNPSAVLQLGLSHASRNAAAERHQSK